MTTFAEKLEAIFNHSEKGAKQLEGPNFYKKYGIDNLYHMHYAATGDVVKFFIAGQILTLCNIVLSEKTRRERIWSTAYTR